MINVTKTFLPNIEEYIEYLKRIWANEWLTNRGELLLELEEQLRNKLDVDNLILMTNGTLPLQIALKGLCEKGEIITTPFSYVATTSSILWEGFTPVFVDIDTQFFCIDENKIEKAITKNTKGILATHVFGNPCNVDVIEKIAKRNNLKVIYDGAHCFGVKYKNKSIFHYGDASTCSFHATKLFHTAEGGMLVTNNKDYFHKFFYSHNFGHNGPLNFHGLGINGKMSELQAAMGLSVLPSVEKIIEERSKVVEYYNSEVSDNLVQKIQIREGTEWNYSYYPVVFKTENQLLSVIQKLNEKNINPRRYFNPSLNTLEFLSSKRQMPISEDIARRVLCLPLFCGIEDETIEIISRAINTIK